MEKVLDLISFAMIHFVLHKRWTQSQKSCKKFRSVNKSIVLNCQVRSTRTSRYHQSNQCQSLTCLTSKDPFQTSLDLNAKNPHSKYIVERIGILLKVVFSAGEIQRKDKNLRLYLIWSLKSTKSMSKCGSICQKIRLKIGKAYKAVHTVSFGWFLSGLERILNFEFCLL